VRRRLVALRLVEGADVRPHFDDMIAMKRDLSGCGDVISDVDFLNLLMASLPRSWQGYVSSMRGLMSLRDELVKPRDFMTHVIEEYERRTFTNAKRRSKEKADDFALTTSTNDRNKKNIECFNCKKKGHRKADCWAKGGEKEGEGPRSKKKGKETVKETAKETAKAALDEEDGVWMAYIKDEESPDLSSHDGSNFDPFTFALGHSLDLDLPITTINDPPPVNDRAIIASRVTDALEPVAIAAEDGTLEVDLYDSGASRHMSSCASRHMSSYRHKFSNYRSIEPRSIRAADD
jgi:hypothetical protein